jgi:hypothetical protein
MRLYYKEGREEEFGCWHQKKKEIGCVAYAFQRYNIQLH